MFFRDKKHGKRRSIFFPEGVSKRKINRGGDRYPDEMPLWVIKCPAPDDETKIRWGDYHFALSLQKNLEKLGLYVIVQMREEWYCEMTADVVIVIRGGTAYHPKHKNPFCKYIIWNISHPDQITREEYELYDAVCVGSKYYAEQLKHYISAPVYPLLQCTDTELFYPAMSSGQTPVKYQYIFIGNSRGIARESVMWALEDNLPLTMWGYGWNKILKDHLDIIQNLYIENRDIPELYRNSKATLNDHWKDMLEKQFINNRIFDALSCGLPIISDTCPELREIFPDAVLHYSNRLEFEECIDRINNDYDAVKTSVLSQQELIRQEYSFEVRAKQLKTIVDSIL